MSSELRDQLQATLSGIYTLERELGGGGMSRVFLAEEARLGRRVVVKVLAPELTEGISAERFEREVTLAARLQHPNIVPLLAAGERGGLAYYTMPFVEGESLRARLAREGRLPQDAAMSVLRDVARALEYAHARGVVHRDIKPENILLAGSAAAVADFGVAKALHVARTAGTADAPGDGEVVGGAGETLTRVGTSLGTPAYMAPEQAAGDPDVDGRADVYSWGVVAYELLAGSPPFAGRSSHQLIVAHIGERPLPVTERAPGVPPALGALVMRCLEKDPAKRPQSAGELLAALEAAHMPSGTQAPAGVKATTAGGGWTRLAAGTVAAVLLVLLFAALVSRSRRASVPARPVLAVLPFENLGPADDSYFADGLTDEVRGRLATLSGLQVIGGTSARRYKGTTKPAREIARELGATYLLTATVRWDRTPNGAGRVRVSPELVRAVDQTSVWAEPVEGPLDDVFQMQTRVAERVAAALDVALLGRERRGTSPPPTRNLAAYDAYLRGIAYSADLRVSEPARRAAILALEHAVALDPRFAAAHAQLAIAYVAERGFGHDSGGLLEKARMSAERAMALDSTLVESQSALARYRSEVDDVTGAYRAWQAAARLAPSDPDVLMGLAEMQEALGHLEEAIPLYEHGALLEPRWPYPLGQLAGAYDRLGRYEEAIQTQERALAISPEGGFGPLFHAARYLLWRADTVAARLVIERTDARPVDDLLIRLPSHFAGRAIWLSVLPREILLAKDTITRAAYVRGDWGTPELYHLMKARHFALTRRPELARAHADSLIARLEPAVRRGPGIGVLIDLYSPLAMLAEGYAYVGRPADAAQSIDRYVEERRRKLNKSALRLPYALVNAAYIDVLIGRRDLAVTRLEEAFRLPSGQWISRPLLRADPSWAPLRGHPGFQRLVAGHD
jgi:serine/threonine-protein kinase